MLERIPAYYHLENCWVFLGKKSELIQELEQYQAFFEIRNTHVFLIDPEIKLCALEKSGLKEEYEFALPQLDEVVQEALSRQARLKAAQEEVEKGLMAVPGVYKDGRIWRFDAGGEQERTKFTRAEAPGRGILYQGEFANFWADPFVEGPVSAAILSLLWPILQTLPEGLDIGGMPPSWAKPWGYLKAVENDLIHWSRGQSKLLTTFRLLANLPIKSEVEQLINSREEIE